MGRGHQEEILHREKDLVAEKERIDNYLHWTCLFPSRSIVSRESRHGHITVNGHPVRASKIIRPGDKIAFEKADSQVALQVLALPEKQASTKEARNYYKLLGREQRTEKR